MSGRAMNRKPVDQAPDYRQKMWEVIRKYAASVTLTQIHGGANAHRRTALDYTTGLESAGFIRRTVENPLTFELVKDCGHHAPRVRKDGSLIAQGGGTENMWRTMQHLPEFTSVDVAAHATTDTVAVTKEVAQAYISMLFRTGYLRVIRKAEPMAGRLATYRLVRNTGPRPPKIQRVKRVFDPNTGATHGREVME